MSNNIIQIKLNNKNFEVQNNYNILQVCSENNIDIPKFCYHDKLSIAGNCRMCLVEVKGNLKPIASCSIPIFKNMEIYTNTKLVKKAREGILEFILLNHPLDCPICDQGGECDLQDQTLFFGNDKGRFYEIKRSTQDKNCGPLIKTLMTRCIHCTRCIRYMREIAGINTLGVVNRGKNMEISNFLKNYLLSEISGNVIDLCPVGALTSKPYSFVARPWELISFKTIDILDSMQVNIRIDIRDLNILRILPIFKNNLNDNLITDLTRFTYDGFKNQRLITPLYKVNNKLIFKSWIEIFFILKKKIKKEKVNFFLGNFLDCETLFILKKLSNIYGNYTIISNSFNKLCNNDYRENYLFNNHIMNNLNNYQNILIFGLLLRLNNPLLNYKLKYFINKNLIKIYTFGSNFNNNFYNINYSNIKKNFINLLEGKLLLSNILIKSEKKNLLIFNEYLFKNILNNQNINEINCYLKKYLKIDLAIFLYNNVNVIANEFNLFNSINNFNDLSFYNNKNNNKEINYFLNTDYIQFNNNNNLSIYQGTTNISSSKFLNKFNIILPSVNNFEKNSIFINFFGNVQKSNFIFYPTKLARVDWKILYFFFKLILKINLKKIIKLNEIRKFFFFFEKSLIIYNKINFLNLKFKKFILLNNNINNFNTNFFKLNQIAKASIIFKNCNNEFKKKYTNFS